MTQPLPDLVSDTRLKVELVDGCAVQEHRQPDPANVRRPITVQRRWKRAKMIGRGSSGSVWLEECEDTPTAGEKRAVKVVNAGGRNLLGDPGCVRELEAIAKFSQERYWQWFVRSYGWYETELSLCITMEYLALGDLGRLSGTMPENQVRDVAQQVLTGLNYMHDGGFVHRDLKPENILVVQPGPEWWVKIADFGIAKRIARTATHTLTGTQSYIAPEVYGIRGSADDRVGEAAYSFPVDVWSVGAIIFRLLAGCVAFDTIGDLVDYVVQKAPFPSAGLSQASVSYVKLLMAASPQQRPSCEEALQRLWIPETSGAGLSATNGPSPRNKPSTFFTEPSARWSMTERSQLLPGWNTIPSHAASQPNAYANEVTNTGSAWHLHASANHSLIPQPTPASSPEEAIESSSGTIGDPPSLLDSTIMQHLAFTPTASDPDHSEFQISEDGMTIAWTRGEMPWEVEVWRADANGRFQRAQTLLIPRRVSYLALSRNGNVLVCSGDKRHSFFRADRGGPLKLIRQVDVQKNCRSLTIAPDGKQFASGSFSGWIYIRPTEQTTQEPQVSHLLKSRPFLGSRASKAKTELTSLSFTSSTSNITRRPILSLTFSPDGLYLAATEGTSVALWRRDSNGWSTKTNCVPLGGEFNQLQLKMAADEIFCIGSYSRFIIGINLMQPTQEVRVIRRILDMKPLLATPELNILRVDHHDDGGTGGFASSSDALFAVRGAYSQSIQVYQSNAVDQDKCPIMSFELPDLLQKGFEQDTVRLRLAKNKLMAVVLRTGDVIIWDISPPSQGQDVSADT